MIQFQTVQLIQAAEQGKPGDKKDQR